MEYTRTRLFPFPGILIWRFSEDFIKGDERSVLRNPLTAEVLYKSKDIEKWGSGLKRIVDECTEKDVKVQFQTLKTGFLVSFLRTPELTGEPPGKTPQKTPQIILTGLESRILREITRDPRLSREKLARVLEISTDTVKEYLSRLKKKGAIKRLGPDKGGYWEIAQ
ncbi:MAG: winged helix-turn-helix transcriptional regulator [Candidatus Omnitrophota bacterium]